MKEDNNKYLPQELISYWNADEKSDNTDIQKKLISAYALNLCTVSVSRIINNRDQYVMDQEYDAILNNLNLHNMPDSDSLLKVLKEIMDVITFFKIQEEDKKWIEEDYKQELKQNLSKAVNIAGLMGSIQSMGLANLTNPMGWIKTGLSVASTVGIGYINYQSGKSQARLKKQKQEWELQRSAIEQLNGLRRELFDTAWHLTKEFGIYDEFRLTENQIEQYLDILKDYDDFKRFERLDYVKKKFLAYPPFWYQLGHTARLVALSNPNNQDYYENYSKACFEFFCNQIKTNLLRDDEIASSCALEYAEMLNPEIEGDKKKISDLLETAVKFSGNKNDVLQMCAIGYMRIGQINEASRIFWRLVNEQYDENFNAEMLSMIYYQLYISVLKDENLTDRQLVNTKDKSFCLIPVEPLMGKDEEVKKQAIEYVYNMLRLRATEKAYLIPLPTENSSITEAGYVQQRTALLRAKVNEVIKDVYYRYINDFSSIVFPKTIAGELIITDNSNVSEWLSSNIQKTVLQIGYENYVSSLSSESLRIQVYHVLNEFFGCIGEFSEGLSFEQILTVELEEQIKDITYSFIANNESFLSNAEKVLSGKDDKTKYDLIKNNISFFDISNLFGLIDPAIRAFFENLLQNAKDINRISDLERQLYLFAKKYGYEIPTISYIGDLNNDDITRDSKPFTFDSKAFGIDNLEAYEKERQLERARIEAIISTISDCRDKIILDSDKCQFYVSGDDNYRYHIDGIKKINRQIPIAVLFLKYRMHFLDKNIAFDAEGVHWLEEGVSAKYSDVVFDDKNKMVIQGKKLSLDGVEINALRALIDKLKALASNADIKERKFINEDWIEKKARKIVNMYTAMSAVNGFNPIPLANLGPQMSILVSMMFAIAGTYKIKADKEQLRKLAIKVIEKSTSSLVVGEVAKALIQFVPGGFVVGGAISGSLTFATGSSFIEYCKSIISGESVNNEVNVDKAFEIMHPLFDKEIDKKHSEIVETQKTSITNSTWDTEVLTGSMIEARDAIKQTAQNIISAQNSISQSHQETENQIDSDWDEIKKRMK